MKGSTLLDWNTFGRWLGQAVTETYLEVLRRSIWTFRCWYHSIRAFYAVWWNAYPKRKVKPKQIPEPNHDLFQSDSSLRSKFRSYSYCTQFRPVQPPSRWNPIQLIFSWLVMWCDVMWCDLLYYRRRRSWRFSYAEAGALATPKLAL